MGKFRAFSSMLAVVALVGVLLTFGSSGAGSTAGPGVMLWVGRNDCCDARCSHHRNVRSRCDCRHLGP